MSEIKTFGTVTQWKGAGITCAHVLAIRTVELCSRWMPTELNSSPSRRSLLEIVMMKVLRIDLNTGGNSISQEDGCIALECSTRVGIIKAVNTFPRANVLHSPPLGSTHCKNCQLFFSYFLCFALQIQVYCNNSLKMCPITKPSQN